MDTRETLESGRRKGEPSPPFLLVPAVKVTYQLSSSSTQRTGIFTPTRRHQPRSGVRPCLRGLNTTSSDSQPKLRGALTPALGACSFPSGLPQSSLSHLLSGPSHVMTNSLYSNLHVLKCHSGFCFPDQNLMVCVCVSKLWSGQTGN